MQDDLPPEPTTMMSLTVKRLVRWISEHKATAASIVAVSGLAYSYFSNARDIIADVRWLLDLDNWFWIAKFSQTAFFPWFALALFLGLIYFLMVRAIRSDQSNAAKEAKARESFRDDVSDQIRDCLGDYDRRLDTVFKLNAALVECNVLLGPVDNHLEAMSAATRFQHAA